MREVPRGRGSRLAPPTMLDRVIGWMSPAAGLERLRARTLLMAATGDGSWKGGRKDRRATRNWRPAGGSADADTLLDLPDLRARARDLSRNAPIATGAIATSVTGVLGAGLKLQASIDAEALGLGDEAADAAEREQEREFALFAARCDFSRVQRFGALQRLVLRAQKDSGDVLIVRRYRKDPGDAYGTKLQVIEADRLSNPNRVADTETLAGGVETDRDGVPQRYHVSDKHPGNLRLQPTKWEAIPARTDDGLATVIHLFDRDRPELTRGLPFLAPVVEHLKQISDYSDAEVTAAVIGAMTTVFIESTADEDASGEPPLGETDSTLAANEVKLGTGAVVSLMPGEKANMVDPVRPNAQFDPFMTAFLRQVGVALRLPYELLIKHFTASYSASRAALEMAWQEFTVERDHFVDTVCQEVYGWAMDEAVASGRIARPGWFADPGIRAAYLGANWVGPRRYSLNPQQEAAADELDIRTGVKTREEVCIERTGGEFEKKARQLVKEQQLLPKPAAAPAQAKQQDGPDEQDAKERKAS